jgi:hypothetical protein
MALVGDVAVAPKVDDRSDLDAKQKSSTSSSASGPHEDWAGARGDVQYRVDSFQTRSDFGLRRTRVRVLPGPTKQSALNNKPGHLVRSKSEFYKCTFL